MEVVDRLVIWSVVWPVVSGFVGVPSVFNGSLFSLLRPLSLPKSILSLGLLLSFSLTASSCLRSGKKNNAHHLVKYGVSGEYTPNKFPPLKLCSKHAKPFSFITRLILCIILFAFLPVVVDHFTAVGPAFDRTWHWGWPCLDTSLFHFLKEIMLKNTS